ncbi:HK97-gp10 family putative phage morphogenesis protein [Bradyrhizobium sp. NP1]|uniref:HK97-gp10 family putative phage morphogenesis protein n=1 Tax=Bradyrhizobium sp. NP1 TaxID=3049772 RepID=UPI0025A5BBC4|nr:HK97-gp10 family putative phage morphogenesis protein [Bradyrhizobium sp. NP1]WJR76016.1 HK97 gp10 family phage protein [Bradyrhizobium sp. NP1]
MPDDLDAYLDALPDKLREQLSEVIREQAERLSAAQKAALQSLEQTDETGDLEASCTVVPGANDLEFIVQAGGPLTTTEVREGSGKPYDYALAFEFGTSHQPARPFFYSTYNAMRDDMQEAITEAVNEVLND